MKNILIKAGGSVGRIFEGESGPTYCFVPDGFIFFEDGKLRIEEGDYVRSGWDVRNMRFNDFGTGQHLFPNTDRPVVNLDDDSVRVFLQRIENVRGCLASQIQFCSITAGLQMRLLGGEVPQ